MSTRVIVNGAMGKMGKIAVEAINKHRDFELVASLSRADDLQDSIIHAGAEIVIELTNAHCVYTNALTIINNGAHPVIGASGLLPAQIQHLIDLCNKKTLGGIIAPNFSIAAILMMNFAAMAARFLSEVEIVEIHHQQKLDAPSATAMKTAEMISASRGVQKHKLILEELLTGARGATHYDVNIHSLRLPGVVARQDVIFGGSGETLSISHNSIDRSAFMPGIILACESVQKLDQMHYGLEYLLGLGVATKGA